MTEEPKDIYGVESTQPHAGERGADDHSPAPSVPSSPRAGRPIDPAPSADAHEAAAREPLNREPPVHEPPAHQPPAPRRPDPLPLEASDVDETPPALRSVKELDVCPNCGASMRSASDVVCLRCGFDLKSMKQVATATGVVEVAKPGVLADDDQQRLQRRPLVVEGLGGTNAPLIAAAVAAAILALAYLAGWGGVFKPVIINGEAAPGADVPMGDRFVGLLRFAVSVAMWTGCGLGSLAFTAYLNGLRLGDVALAAARMLGIVAVMHLATLMSFASSPVEWTLEAIAQAAIFAALSMVIFSLKPKDLPILVGGAIILFLTMWVSAWVVVWGTG